MAPRRQSRGQYAHVQRDKKVNAYIDVNRCAYISYRPCFVMALTKIRENQRLVDTDSTSQGKWQQKLVQYVSQSDFDIRKENKA
jgi:hypothetical protein